MSENKNVPQIRFKGFTGDWEKRKFNNIVNRVSVQSNSDNLPKVEFEDIVSGEGILNKDISSKFDNRKGIAFEPNHILYGKLRPYLKNWLFADFKGVALGDFWVFEASESIPIFDYYLIQTAQYQEVANLSTGTKMPRSDWNTVSDTDFFIPVDIDEQIAIGNFFNTLDTTITLHKRKLYGLRELKKAYLQQMFPQAGESVPRLRFKGFTGEWVQRKFGEVAEIIGGGTPDTTNSDYWDGDVDWYSPIEIGKEIYAFSSQRKITELGLRRSSAKILPADKTILFTSRAGIGDMAILKNPAATNQGFQSLVVNEDFDVYFAFSMGSKIKEYALKNASGSTFLEISGKGLSKMEVYIPTLNEQTAIGNFFRNLDNQITSQTQKLEHLKKLKSAYLQKMFI